MNGPVLHFSVAHRPDFVIFIHHITSNSRANATTTIQAARRTIDTQQTQINTISHLNHPISSGSLKNTVLPISSERSAKSVSGFSLLVTPTVFLQSLDAQRVKFRFCRNCVFRIRCIIQARFSQLDCITDIHDCTISTNRAPMGSNSSLRPSILSLSTLIVRTPPSL